MSIEAVIQIERPDQPDVTALLDALDAYLAGLYSPEDNYLLGVQALLAPEIRFLVARRGGVAVGCGAVRMVPAEAATGDRRYGEVKRMYVAPEHRGRRLAEQVLRALELELFAEGVHQALLETGRHQTEAVRLYERCGYRQRAPFGAYPDNGLSLFYEKRI